MKISKMLINLVKITIMKNIVDLSDLLRISLVSFFYLLN